MSNSIYHLAPEIKHNLAKLLKKLLKLEKLLIGSLMKKLQMFYPKLDPHPQVLVALGLINLKPIPIKLVT
jgi:hypothetical protein